MAEKELMARLAAVEAGQMTLLTRLIGLQTCARALIALQPDRDVMKTALLAAQADVLESLESAASAGDLAQIATQLDQVLWLTSSGLVGAPAPD